MFLLARIFFESLLSLMGDFLDFASEKEREKEKDRMSLKLLEGPSSVAKHELRVYINNVYKLIKYKNYKLINKILARRV